ncbi:PTS glucose transporter subunit IIA [Acetatifactor aquisgranensis]|uniref:PTS glucose transporter subunit IIA n=1 Tax=Acetatifactor aquisgranensis TaxID=2941233 RepID=UPI0020410C8B|nr:PTS glucose transporter subunit IIA [Acetatifactor aquisgranensis]
MMMLGVMWMMTAVVVGFMLGRVSMYGQDLAPDEQGEMEEGRSMEEDTQTRAGRGFPWSKKGHHEVEKVHWSVGSPVSGFAEVREDGERSVVVIDPNCDCVYAPANGKITRLFPMGNAFRLVTEFGAELYVQVGDGDDELMGEYYRPRIMQNEIVGKGKLLIEFDKKRLEMAGASCRVSVCVEGCRYGGNVKETAGEQVRIGEEIFRIQGEAGQEIPIRDRAFG